jgi:hypothetical protein
MRIKLLLMSSFVLCISCVNTNESILEQVETLNSPNELYISEVDTTTNVTREEVSSFVTNYLKKDKFKGSYTCH